MIQIDIPGLATTFHSMMPWPKPSTLLFTRSTQRTSTATKYPSSYKEHHKYKYHWRKCCRFGAVFVAGCSEVCHLDNFRCGWRLGLRPDGDIFVSVMSVLWDCPYRYRNRYPIPWSYCDTTEYFILFVFLSNIALINNILTVSSIYVFIIIIVLTIFSMYFYLHVYIPSPRAIAYKYIYLLKVVD